MLTGLLGHFPYWYKSKRKVAATVDVPQDTDTFERKDGRDRDSFYYLLKFSRRTVNVVGFSIGPAEPGSGDAGDCIHEYFPTIAPKMRTFILHVPLNPLPDAEEDKMDSGNDQHLDRFSLLAEPLRMIHIRPGDFTRLKEIILKLEYTCVHHWTPEGPTCTFSLSTLQPQNTLRSANRKNGRSQSESTFCPLPNSVRDALKAVLDDYEDVRLRVQVKTLCEPDVLYQVDVAAWFEGVVDAARIDHDVGVDR